jgi:cytochrome c2
MPATEQTWYNARWMHVIFGVSALALLFTTLWMLVADHNRPWKEPQRNFATLEARFLEMQALQQRTVAFDTELRHREDALSLAKVGAAPAEAVRGFKEVATTVMADHNVRGQEKHLRAIDEANERLAKNLPANDDAKLEAAGAARADLIAALQATIKDIKFVEDTTARDKKTQGSQRDAARSKYEISIRDALPKSVAEERLHKFEDLEAKVNELDRKVGEIKAGRNQLENLVKQITKPVDDAEKAVKDQRAEFDRLHKAEKDREPNWGKWLLELPIINAFGDPLRIQQIWLPNLKIKYPLNQVARFDRCMTCHLGMDRALPGAPTDPAYPHEDRVFVNLKPRTPAPQDDGQPAKPTFENAYGMKIADAGLLNENDVTVVVFPRSPAAEAGVRTADVLAAVNGTKVIDPAAAERMLLDAVDWKNPTPIAVEIRRGLPHPYSAHPRLDLFGSDSSPHAFGKFGCTICHEGQGTATAFQAAEHSPNTVAEEDRWRNDFKWAANHYWDWPQKPKRFIESSCLKCHHDVVELRPSEKFPDAPAPKLVRGYDLIREYGCFGCHEIKGFAGPNERIGPDLRTEPDYYAWAAVLKQQIAPQLAKFQPAAADARKAEFDLAKQKDSLATRKKDAEAAKRTDEIAQIDADVKKVDEQMTALTAKRLTAEAPINDLQHIVELADKVRAMPDDSSAREQLMAQLSSDADRAAKHKALEDQKAKYAAAEAAAKTAKDADRQAAAAQQIKDADAQLAALPAMLLTSASHRIADHFKDVESPGTMRKVGPSLRYVSSKLDGAFLHDWISNPKHFRPTTRMPRFFGQYDHLQDSASLVDAKRFEEVEIQGIVAYLQQNSQPFEYQTPPAGNVAEAPADAADATAAPTGQIARGRQLFITRGCIACHSMHDEGRKVDDEVAKALAQANQHQGPDLSKIGAKLAAGARANGRDPQKWLYTWLKQPSQYHARTKMPNLQLNPIEEVDAAGKVVMTTVDGRQVPKTTDPAADIAAFLFSLKGWEPLPTPAVVQKDVDDLAYMHLGKAYRAADAQEYLAKGIHGKREDLKGDEIELFVEAGKTPSPEELNRKKLLYVGRRAISKYGCFGCHDLPGFEDAKAIGTGLADWGRKEVDKLAFEQIAQYVGGHGPHGAAHDEGEHAAHGEHESTEIVEKSNDAKRKADNHEYFHHELLHGSRAGFAWQKIREPRSYDYKKTETKTFNEWLRMPKFTFPESEDDVEAVMTFVLGLVSEPPAAQYIYNPSPQKKAIVEGLAVLDKYNCAGCHVLRSERLTVKYTPSRPGIPSEFPPPEPFTGYDFLRRNASADQLSASMKEGFDGRAIAVLHGLPDLQREAPLEYLAEDATGATKYEPDPAFPAPDKLYRPFMLWESALVDGKAYYVNQKAVGVPLWLIDKQHSYPAWGGTAARLIMPLAFSITKPNRQDLTGNGTWALVPPPLLGEGRKVQPEWLHDFLLDPHPIRPAAVLRMPKFNMSEAESWKLVHYFAAVDNVDQTNTFDARTREDHLISIDKQHPNSLQDSLKVTVSVCSRCHMIGDFVPAGHASAKAPNLQRIHKRLRPEYLRPWLANPNSILPYTNMPVNFPHDSLSNQSLYPGTSREQLESEVDFLLNYDTFMKNEVPMSKFVEKFAPPPAPAPAAAGDAAPGKAAPEKTAPEKPAPEKAAPPDDK